jgi:hypothetical protein
MGDLVSLQRWRESRSGCEEPEDVTTKPQLISTIWLNKYGPLRAHVDLNGALAIEHDKPLPPMVMRDLARSTIVYFDGLQKPPEELACKQPLRVWLEDGESAKQLKFIQPTGFQVPFGATALALVIIDGPHTLIIGWVNYFPDERLIRALKAKKLSGGQSHRP